jgi:hypothetical protein
VDVFYHLGDDDVVARHVDDDVVLADPDPGDARYVGQLVAVLVPNLRDAVEMLFRLPKITIVDRAIRPSESSGFGAY